MRDRDDGARVLLQESLQPGDRFSVQVVRRLVEKKQIGPLQQEPAERHPAPFAPRDRAHVGVGRRAAQRVHGDLERPVELPGIRRVDLILHLRLVLQKSLHLVRIERLGELLADFIEAVQERARRGDTFLDVAEDRLARVEARLLRQIPHLDPLGGERFAHELPVLARHDLQEGGLSGAVRPEDADLGAEVKRQPDPLQDLALRRDRSAQVLHGEDELGRHHFSSWPECFCR